MALAIHAGFALLDVGTVRQKNQVNALSKILSAVEPFGTPFHDFAGSVSQD